MSLQDEIDIRNLVSSYADAVCRRDKDAWAANWADDCLWVLPGMGETRGRDAVVQLWVSAMSRFPFVTQLVLNGLVRVDGDRAEGRWYLNEFIKIDGGGGMFNIGVYQDRYVKRSGRWSFAERHYTVLYNDKGKGDMSGDASPFPPLRTLLNDRA
jgi:uncharacterized protein (TIGR02246 family)